MEYTIVVETLKIMYQKKEIEISKIRNFLTNKVISLDEYDYILGKKG